VQWKPPHLLAKSRPPHLEMTENVHPASSHISSQKPPVMTNSQVVPLSNFRVSLRTKSPPNHEFRTADSNGAYKSCQSGTGWIEKLQYHRWWGRFAIHIKQLSWQRLACPVVETVCLQSEIQKSDRWHDHGSKAQSDQLEIDASIWRFCPWRCLVIANSVR